VGEYGVEGASLRYAEPWLIAITRSQDELRLQVGKYVVRLGRRVSDHPTNVLLRQEREGRKTLAGEFHPLGTGRRTPLLANYELRTIGKD
jgi:hypothetical protein